MENNKSIGNYLIERLLQLGVNHVFGVPGDFVLGFNKLLEKSELEFINTCDEQGAGFAADAYARLRGLGVVCVTYCVGGLKIANTTAQCFAEKSPVVVISGSPGVNERTKNPLLHHKVKEFDTQYKVFQEITVASTVLDNPDTAYSEIERVLTAALRYKRPVYIEIPRDMVNVTLGTDNRPSTNNASSNPDALQEALEEAVNLINQAHHPVILAGVEIHRFKLQESLVKLVEKTNLPVAETLLGKSVINEMHPNNLGIYEGAMGKEFTRKYVEESDCVIALGTFLSDVNLGIFTAKLNPQSFIDVNSEKTSIHFHNYEDISLVDFLNGLLNADLKHRQVDLPSRLPLSTDFSVKPGEKITVQRLFEQLNLFISNDMIVIADVGDALFAGADLVVHQKSRFLSPAYYASLGFAVPASIGAQMANPNIRPLVLVGDGAFQMTGMELSTIVRYGLNPIIIVLNNLGYGTERPMQDGKFNDILLWNYSQLPTIFNKGKGFDIRTEDELELALEKSQTYTEGFCLLDVHLDPSDTSLALKRLTKALREKV
ncbi:alpha-keto acid decarboxylase family protein [Cyanothece sp. BG0011]|uniref:alpha-keto acid decarboxylase family protein n=1 Tax=Cyanothece sp. BG0011 TaxID=2082950 RepID=UPI000D1EA6BB|nr:thiamine pyrophosphate-binding protein [Cyanothece sp. BG0011]